MSALHIVDIGEHRLILGDAYEVIPEIAVCIPPKEAACVTDPPYEFETSGGGKMRAARPYLDLIERTGLAAGFDDSFLTPQLFASVVVFCHDNQIASLKATLERRYGRAPLLAWRKSDPPPWRNKHYLADVEHYIHAWTEGAHPVGEHHDMHRIWDGRIGKSVYEHPTVKPLDLLQKIIRNVQGRMIVDPFMGTGTTGVAAVMAGRRFIGIERDEKWFRIACERVGEAEKVRAGDSGRETMPAPDRDGDQAKSAGAAANETGELFK